MTPNLLTLAQETGQLLLARNWKLVTAESCTGGGLSYWITAVPGSSDWFDRGFVTYQNDAKRQMLGIKLSTLKTHGAVSEQTAQEMAENALTHSEAQVSIAITGIAGPSGGTKEKPVGTVWIAWHVNHQSHTEQHRFKGSRLDIREQAIECALSKLNEFLRY